MLKSKLDQDLKAALLLGDKAKAEVLRSLKSAILYEEVAQKARESGLSDEVILQVFAREAKKRQESADMYAKAGAADRRAQELSEKAIIDTYLPQQLSDEELRDVVVAVVGDGNSEMQMGQIIGAVKAKVGQAAEGARIAAVVRAVLESK